MMRAAELPKLEKTLIRTVAGAARPLSKDVKLTPLQAIDRLLALREEFRDMWADPSPWLVLKGGWGLPADTPIAQMLEDFKTHGEPIGIVGMAYLKFSEREALLRLHFRKDKRNRKMLDAFADQLRAEWNDLTDREQLVFSAKVFLDEASNNITMHYDFLPEQPTLAPGAKRLGTIVYKRDGKMVSYVQNKRYADGMKQGQEHFRNMIKKLNEIQREDFGKN